MKKAYLYLHQQRFELYRSDHKLSSTERFCEALGEEYTLLGNYDTEDLFEVGKMTPKHGDGGERIRCERKMFTTYDPRIGRKDI